MNDKRCDQTIDFVDAMHGSSEPDDRNINGLELQALREVKASYCEHCRAEILGIKIKRFCDDACGQRHRRAKKKLIKFIEKSEPREK